MVALVGVGAAEAAEEEATATPFVLYCIGVMLSCVYHSLHCHLIVSHVGSDTVDEDAVSAVGGGGGVVVAAAAV